MLPAETTNPSAAKQFETLRAQLALAGYALHPVDNGNGVATYMVSRWAMSRPLADLHAVRQFMRQVGAGQ